LAIEGVLSTLATSSDFLFDGFRKLVVYSASLVISLSAPPKRGSVLDIGLNYFPRPLVVDMKVEGKCLVQGK
jgi:hypothetical protein